MAPFLLVHKKQRAPTRAHTSYLSFLLHWQDFRKPNFTPKKRLKAPKTLKMSLKKSNICIFFTQSGKICTWQKSFTQAPPVVPVTNMRYESLWRPRMSLTHLTQREHIQTICALMFADPSRDQVCDSPSGTNRHEFYSKSVGCMYASSKWKEGLIFEGRRVRLWRKTAPIS